MKIAILAAVALLACGPAVAQTTAAPASPPVAAQVLAPITTPPADVSVLAGAALAPDCGGLGGLQGRAFCVSALLTQIGGLAEAYITDLQAKGWIVAAGDDNRVVFVRRTGDATCEGLQMQAAYDTSSAPAPTSPGYLAFGRVPGNVCAAQATAP